MYKIQLFELAKPVGSDDNEAVEAGSVQVEDEMEVLAEVRRHLPTLGGPNGKWLEIAREDEPINFPDKEYEAKYAHACGYHD